jgi:hypothetical protein
MIAIQQKQTFPVNAIWLAAALAVLAALSYVMMAWGILSVGDLQAAERPAGIIYTAAGCYFLGGLLILARRRWLWIIGVLMNGLVILFFFQMYQARPEVMLSPGGLASKTAQLLLELSLIYLIVSNRVRTQRRQVY